MKRIPMALVLLSACSGVLGGCASSQIQPADMTAEVVVSSSAKLEDAIVQAATRRRWVPSRESDGTIRCTLVQRSNKVVIDIKVQGDSYTIHCVSCNIPQRKYEQWTNNLMREIAKHANR